MKGKLSSRLLAMVEALPLKKGMRVLEIGCGPGSAAREVAARIAGGHVLGIDRSARAVQQASKQSVAETGAASISFRHVAIEDLALAETEEGFDLAFAVRVGAFDGRHPELEEKALARVMQALKPGGKLYIDGQFRCQK